MSHQFTVMKPFQPGKDNTYAISGFNNIQNLSRFCLISQYSTILIHCPALGSIVLNVPVAKVLLNCMEMCFLQHKSLNWTWNIMSCLWFVLTKFGVGSFRLLLSKISVGLSSSFLSYRRCISSCKHSNLLLTVSSEIPVMLWALDLQRVWLPAIFLRKRAEMMMMRWWRRRRRSAFLRSACTFHPFTQQLAKSSCSVAVTLVQNLSDFSRHFAEILHSPAHSPVFPTLCESLQAHCFWIVIVFTLSNTSIQLFGSTFLADIIAKKSTGPVEWSHSAVSF